uniref:Ig-like domain-containing protein n=1 Tax=Cyanoderma ruficeps TaxID=181631 RepID=A0A8C3QPR3_9PASS
VLHSRGFLERGFQGVPGGLILHSLRYLDVAVSEPSLGVPQFMEVGFVDGVRFVRYDSEWGRLEPLTQWVKEAADPEYWDRETQINERNQQVNARNLEILRERYNQSRGLHTRQRVYGCDLLSDGSVDGSIRYGYDGRDFISFDLGSGRFVAADSAAEITRRRWEEDGTVAEGFTNYLGHECPDRLRKYVGYGQKELERKEPPAVHVSGKEEHGTLILSCHAYGFYPQTIAVNWMKGDEIWDQETEWGGVVPNSDGTFHTWARIEALPEEREQYRCRVEHPGMPEPGIFAWGEAGKVGMWEFPNGDSSSSPPHYPVFSQSRNLAGMSPRWSLDPSSLPSSSSVSSLEPFSGSSNPVTHGMGIGNGARIHPAPFPESCATDPDPTVFPQGRGTGMDTTWQPVSPSGGSSSGSPLCGSRDGSWG